MPRRFLPFGGAPVLAVLLLAGCSSEPDQPPEGNVGGANSLTVPIRDDEAILPDAGNGASAANGGTETADGRESPDRIPRALRGRWGMAAADCTSPNGDAKGLVTISATSLRFYESVGTVRDVVEWAPRRVHAAFAFTGEGQSWRREMTLDLGPDGTLTRRDFGRDAEPGPMLYRRCPA